MIQKNLITILTVIILLACNMTATISTQTPQVIPSATVAIATARATDTPTATLQPTPTDGFSQVATAVLPPVCNPRMDWQFYTVIAGDTLGSIANRVNSTVTDLTIANCLANPNNLMVGQQIRVPRLPQATITPPIPTPFDRTPRILSFIRTSSYPPMLEWRTEHAGQVLIYISDSTGENRLLGTFDPNSSTPAPITSGVTTFRLTMRDVSGNDVIGPNGLPVYAIAQTSGGNPQPEPECPLSSTVGTGMIDVTPIEASWSSCIFLSSVQSVTLSWANMPVGVRSIEYWFLPTDGTCGGAVQGNPNVIATDMDVSDGVNATWLVGLTDCAGLLYAFGYTEGASFDSGQRPVVIR